jgi:hypothetical protein
MAGEKDIEQQILGTHKVSKEELEKEIATYMREGFVGRDGQKQVARNRLSALNKVRRKITYEEIPGEHIIRGYFLGILENKRRQETKIWLQSTSGETRNIILNSDVPHPENLTPMTPIEVGPVLRRKNIFRGNERWETKPTTTVKLAKLSSTFIDCCPEVHQAKDKGMYALRGMIGAVFPGKDFTGWKKGDPTQNLPKLPVLGKGDKVNMSILVNSGFGQSGEDATYRVKISTLDNLTKLVGEDISWLEQEERAIAELNDMLRGMQVVSFGFLSNEIGRGTDVRRTKPYMNCTNFGWVRAISDVPTKLPDAAGGADIDDEEQEELAGGEDQAQ